MTERTHLRHIVGMRVLVALLALVGQMIGGVMMLPHAAHATEVMGVPVVICHAGGETGPSSGDAPIAPHSGHDCALCPGCLGAAPPPLALTEPPAIPTVPPSVSAAYAPKPDPTGPPAHAARVPPPTGPPLRA